LIILITRPRAGSAKGTVPKLDRGIVEAIASGKRKQQRTPAIMPKTSNSTLQTQFRSMRVLAAQKNATKKPRREAV
jgi:hypothetical protein